MLFRKLLGVILKWRLNSVSSRSIAFKILRLNTGLKPEYMMICLIKENDVLFEEESRWQYQQWLWIFVFGSVWNCNGAGKLGSYKR